VISRAAFNQFVLERPLLHTLTSTVLRLARRSRYTFRHRRLVRNYLGSPGPLKLQVGSGRNGLPGWLNTDVNATSGVAFLDARKPLPFPSRTFDYVFSEHMIEHLDLKHGRALMGEMFRVLKPGGKLRLATPDLEFLIKLYGDDKTKTEAQRYFIRRACEKFLPDTPLQTDTMVINNAVRSWGHQFIYDFKTLRVVLEGWGFSDVVRRCVGESEDVHLRGLEHHQVITGEEYNRLETIVVEAMRPR
jgi:predicted SAM-dependent methyltransferase